MPCCKMVCLSLLHYQPSLIFWRKKLTLADEPRNKALSLINPQCDLEVNTTSIFGDKSDQLLIATAFDKNVPKYGTWCKICSLKSSVKFHQKCWLNRAQSYKTLHVRNLRMFVISQTVCPLQALPAQSHVCWQGWSVPK